MWAPSSKRMHPRRMLQRGRRTQPPRSRGHTGAPSARLRSRGSRSAPLSPRRGQRSRIRHRSNVEPRAINATPTPKKHPTSLEMGCQRVFFCLGPPPAPGSRPSQPRLETVTAPGCPVTVPAHHRYFFLRRAVKPTPIAGYARKCSREHTHKCVVTGLDQLGRRRPPLPGSAGLAGSAGFA